MHALHLLIIPIQCISSRRQLSSSGALDMKRYEGAVDSMLSSMDLNYIAFERSFRTNKGRDHLQMNIVPIPLERVSKVMHAIYFLFSFLTFLLGA